MQLLPLYEYNAIFVICVLFVLDASGQISLTQSSGDSRKT